MALPSGYISISSDKALGIPPKSSKPKYAKLSLKPEEALVLLQFLNNIKTTRKDWHKLDAIHSKLYKAYQKVKNEF
jgi:hypothetical protein